MLGIGLYFHESNKTGQFEQLGWPNTLDREVLALVRNRTFARVPSEGRRPLVKQLSIVTHLLLVR